MQNKNSEYKLTVLGSGTSIPHPKRSGSGFWLETSTGTLLLDCSPSSSQRMAEQHLDWPGLDAIWISHFHLDHCGGLAPFLFGTKHAPNTRERKKPLRIFGPKGLGNLISAFDQADNYRLLDQPFKVEIIEVTPLVPFEVLPNLTGTTLSTLHTAESLAIHLRSVGKELVYTSDTGPFESLAAFSRRVDLLLMECSFVDNKPVDKHLQLNEAMYIIRKSEPRKALLVHLYPEWDDVDFEAEIAKFFPSCEVIEGVDGLSLSF